MKNAGGEARALSDHDLVKLNCDADLDAETEPLGGDGDDGTDRSDMSSDGIPDNLLGVIDRPEHENTESGDESASWL